MTQTSSRFDASAINGLQADPITSYIDGFGKFPRVRTVDEEVRTLEGRYKSSRGTLTANKDAVDIALTTNPNDPAIRSKRLYGSQILELETERANIEKERAQLRVDQQKHNEELEKIADAKNETALKLNLVDSQQSDFSAHYNDLVAKNNNMTKELSSMQQEEDDLQSTVRELALKKEDLAKKLADTTALHHQKQVALIQVSARRVNLSVGNDNVQNDANNYRAQLDQLQKTREELDRHHKDLVRDEKEHHTVVSRLGDMRDRLSKNLSIIVDKIQTLDNMVCDIQEQGVSDYNLDLNPVPTTPLKPQEPLNLPPRKPAGVPKADPFPLNYTAPPHALPNPIVLPPMNRGKYGVTAPASVAVQPGQVPTVHYGRASLKTSQSTYKGAYLSEGNGKLSPPKTAYDFGLNGSPRTQMNADNFGIAHSAQSTGSTVKNSSFCSTIVTPPRNYNQTYERSFGRR